MVTTRHFPTIFSALLLYGASLQAIEPQLAFQPPKKFEKYLSNASDDNDGETDRWLLRQDFSPESVEPFINLLAKIPYGDAGESALSSQSMHMLQYWARTGPSGTVATRLDQITSCIEKLKDPQAHEMLGYWHKKCGQLWQKGDTSTELIDDIAIPKSWKKFFYQTKKNQWRCKVGADQLPCILKGLCTLPSNYSTRQAYSTIAKAMLALCNWDKFKYEEDSDVRHALIDSWFQSIQMHLKNLEDGETKEELCYWWHHALSYSSLSEGIDLLKICLTHGSSVRICTKKTKSILHMPGLDTALCNMARRKGLTPFDEMFDDGKDPISSAIKARDRSRFEALLSTVQFNTPRAQKIGMAAALCALKQKKAKFCFFTLRKLVLKGLNINQAYDNTKSLADIIIQKKSAEEYARLVQGQLPAKLPKQIKGAGEHELFFTTPPEEFLYWLHAALKNNPLTAPAVLLSAGSLQQLYGAAYDIAKQLSYARKIKDQKPIETISSIILRFLGQAFTTGNNMGIHRVLSLAVMLGTVEQDRAGGGIIYAKAVKKSLAHLGKLEQLIAAYLPFYDKRLFRLAFESLSTQQNLYKIVSSKKYVDGKNGNRQKALKNIQDLKITFDRHWMDTRKNLAKKN